MTSKTVKNPFASQIEEEEEEESKISTNSNYSESSMLNKNKILPETESDNFIKSQLEKSGLNEDTLKFGLNMGKQMMKNSRFIDYFSLDGLKPYFDVDNKYVLTKLKYIFFPFLNDQKTDNSLTSIRNIQSKEEQNSEYKYKLERPDLYIPFMSFVTYILLTSFSISFQNEKIFDPELLGKITSKNFFLFIGNGLIIKLLLFIFTKSTLSFIECFAYSGYKFIFLVMFGILSNFTINNLAIYVIFGVACVFDCLFVRKCFSRRLVDDVFKEIMILLTIGLELVMMIFVGLDLYLYS